MTNLKSQPAYVQEAMQGLTKVQRGFVVDGCIHGDFSMATVRALKDRGLFFLFIDSPNGRCGHMRLTPLGETVRGLLSGRALEREEKSHPQALSEPQP